MSLHDLTLIDAADVRRLLPMADCIDAMEHAMTALARGKIALPPRIIAPIADGSAFFGVMPGSSLDPEIYGAKVISLHEDNPRQGRPSIQGFVALFDHHTGVPLALVDGAEITAIRTAAASGLATRVLARENARTLGIFGTGVQALTHIEAVCAVRPIERVVVWGRNPEHAVACAERAARARGIEVSSGSAEEAAGCDVICTVTASPKPILHGSSVRDGAHVNLVGAHTLETREADSELLGKSRVWVDSMESARNEGGDIDLAVKDGALAWEDVVGEIGRVLLGELPARRDELEISVYESLGLVAQDLISAELVLRRWKATEE